MKKDYLQLVSVVLFYFCWWIYQIYNEPFNLGSPFSLQNVMVLVAATVLIIAVVITVLRGKITMNKQLISFSLLHILSILSVSWAISPVSSVSILKFHILLFLPLLIILSTKSTQTRIEILLYFLLLVFLSSLLLSYGSIFIYNLGTRDIIWSLRGLPFDIQPNYQVVATIVALPILLHLIFYSRKNSDRRLAAVLFVIGLGIIAISGSRVSLIVLTFWLAGMVFFDHDSKFGWKGTRIGSFFILCLGVVVTIIVLLYAPHLLGRISSQTSKEIAYLLQSDLSESGPFRSRIYLTMAMLLSNPNTYLHGIGVGNFGNYYAYITGTERYAHPHNELLRFLVETGIGGFALFLGVLQYPVKYGFSSIQRRSNPRILSLSAALLWSYTFLLLIALFQPILGHHQFYVLSALLYSIYLDSTSLEK